MKKNKNLVIISSKFQLFDIVPIIKKLKNKKNTETIVIASNFDIKNTLNKKNIECKLLDDYLNKKTHTKINKSAIRLTDKLNNRSVNGTKIKDLFNYNSVPLWDMERWSILEYLLKVIKYVEALKIIINKENPDKIIINGRNGLLEKTTIAVSTYKKIPVSIVKPNMFYSFFNNFSRLKPSFVKYFYQFREPQRYYFSKIKNFSHKIKIKSRVSKKNKILFFVSTRNQTVVAISVIKKLEKNKKNKIKLIKFGGIITSFQIDDELKKVAMPFSTFESYFTHESRKKARKAINVLLEKWKKLKKNKKFLISLTYDNIHIWSLIEDLFSQLFTTRAYFPQIIKFIELTKCIFEIEDPDIVILIDIFGSFTKTIATVANLNNIPTLYIQHFTTSAHPGFEPIMTSKAALPGRHDKNIYIQLGTQPDKLVITGQSKYDVIPKKIKEFNRKKLCNKLDLDPQKGIFVLTTQPFPHEENQKLLYAVLNAMKKYPDKQLVIKMHPREVNKLFYKKIVNEMHAKNVVITKNVDTIELLIACEIMMTVSSNTALEAIILNKPVIIINLLNKPDFLSLIKKNAAVEVCKSEDLPIMIKEVLSNKKLRNKLNLHGKMLINDYFYKIDGRSSERIANLIEKMKNK